MFWMHMALLLLIPLIMTFFGFLLYKHPPQKINSIYGYRTKSSMKSQETWIFSNKYFGRIWYYLGLIISLLILFIIIFLRPKIFPNEEITNIIISIELIFLFLPIIFTEIKLKK